MLHSYREVFQTFPAYRKGNGSPPVTSDVDRSSEFLGRHGAQHRPKFESQLVSQTISAKSDGDKGLSSLPLIWVEVRDNVIPPHAVPFASDGRGPLFIARANLEGTFFLGKAGPQLTSGAIISYGSLDITVTRYDVLVCAGQLSWEIPLSTATGYIRQDTVVTNYDVNYDLEPSLTHVQDIPENAYNLTDMSRVDSNQRLATPDPDSSIVASNTRVRPRARSNSRYGLSPSESLDVDIRKAYDTFVPLKSPLELTERSRSLPPQARTSADSSFDARAELGIFRCDSAQSAGVTTDIASVTHRHEYVPMSRPSVVASSKPRVRLDCASQDSHRLPTVVSAVEYSAVEYSASERGTPVGSFGRSEISGFREVANVGGRNEHGSPPPEPPAQSVHSGFVQDVLPLRRYPNTGITTSTSVNHHTNQFSSTSATSHSLTSNVIDPRLTNLSNPSPKGDSQFTPTHYSFSSHQMSSDLSLPQPSTVSSRGTWAGTPGSPILCLCTFDDVKDTSRYQSKLANCPVHPATDTIGISSSPGDFGHVDHYDQRTYPITQAHAWQRGTQHQKHQSKDSPSRVPQPPTFPSTDSPPAQSSFVGDRADVDLCSTQYSHHGVPKSPTETSSEDGNTVTSEHMCGCGSEHVCDSEHWQLVSRTTFGIEAQTCDSAESDAVAIELPAPITTNPLNAGIMTDEVKLTHENRVPVTAVFHTTSTEELTSVAPCRGTLVAEECVPLSTVTCTPSLPPSRQQSAQTISCSDSSVTNDKLHRHHEYTDSSVSVRASAAHEENNNSAPARSIVIAVENTQKPSPASNDLRNSSFTKSTLTVVESPPLTADRHEEPYGQSARDKPSQISSIPKLEGGEEDVSTDRKRQTVEVREDHHENGTESEVKPNLTSYPRTVRIFEGNSSESAILSNDRRTNEGTNGAALSLSSANPESKVISSESCVLQDSKTNDIESRYEHRSLDVDIVSKSSIQISSHDSTESSEGHIQRRNRGREEGDSVPVPVSLAPAENIGTQAPAPRRAVENTQKSSPAFDDLRDSSLPEDTRMTGQTSSPVTDLKGGSCGQFVGTDLPTQGSFTPNVCIEHDKVPVSVECMHQDPEGRGDHHAREAESEVTLKSKSNSSVIESLKQSESVIVLNADGRSDETTDSDIPSLSSTHTGRKLSLSEPGVPQDAGIDRIQSAHEYSSEINVASTTLVQTSSHHSIENKVQSSLVTVQGRPCSHDVATDQPCQRFSATKRDSNELAECTHQAAESRGGCHESETESEFKLSSTVHSHSVRIVERSTSETAILDEDNDIPTLPSSPMTTLPPSDPGILQGAGADFIQSRCEHQSSGVNTASITLVQTSNHDCSTESEGYQPAQSFSYIDEPEATLSVHVCPSLVQNNSNSPPFMDKEAENVQKSSPVSNEVRNSSFTSRTDQSLSLVASIHEEPYGRDVTKNYPNQSLSSPKLVADEEGATADRMHQAVIELGCERQSIDVNDVSKTPESEQTGSRSLSESSEWHTQQQGRQQAHSAGIVVLHVGESNTTPPQFLDIAVKNTQTSSPTPDDLRRSSMPESTSWISQTPAGDNLQGTTPDHDVISDRKSSQASCIPKSEDNKVDLSPGCVHQASVTRGDYHEQETKSEVEKTVAYQFCSVEMLGRSSSDTVTGNSDRRMDKDADDTASPPSSTTVRPKLSISEPDIPQDAAASSKVITVLTTSTQTSSHNSTVRSEHVRRQPAQAFSCSDESHIDYKVNESQTATSVNPFLAPGENNPTPAQLFEVVSETTQQQSPASNNVTRNSSLPQGVSMTGQPSSLATHECSEPRGQDGARDLPNQGSSTSKFKDDQVEISADYCTCEVIEDTRNHKSDTTDGPEETRAGAKVAVLPSSSPNLGSKEPPSEPSVPQDAATNLVQFEREHHFTENITVSVMSVHASSNFLTDSSNGCAYLDNSSQQSNKPPGMISVPPMHDGPCSPPPEFCGVHDSLNCSCVSRVIASPVSDAGDSTAVVASEIVKESVSSDDDHPTPYAEETSGVKPRQDNCTKAVISMACDSNTVQTSSQSENQDNAADTKRCGVQGSACMTVSMLSDDCRASTATTATKDSPSADEQLTQTAATDFTHESRSTTDSLPTKLC